MSISNIVCLLSVRTSGRVSNAFASITRLEFTRTIQALLLHDAYQLVIALLGPLIREELRIIMIILQELKEMVIVN